MYFTESWKIILVKSTFGEGLQEIELRNTFCEINWGMILNLHGGFSSTSKHAIFCVLHLQNQNFEMPNNWY